MCLIAIACDLHPELPFILAANRDEYFARPSQPAQFWNDAPQVLAGRDLQQGGTWLGMTRSGRLAAVTNFREGGKPRTGRLSRGWLVRDFLTSDQPAAAFLDDVDANHAAYDGFNLLVGSHAGLYHYSNRTREVTPLGPGVHGLSNHLLNTPWPKVERAKARLRALQALDAQDVMERLWALLADDAHASESDLPETGVSREWERVLSSAFIRTPEYGTRASTLVVVDRHGAATFSERTFSPIGEMDEERRYDLSLR